MPGRTRIQAFSSQFRPFPGDVAEVSAVAEHTNTLSGLGSEIVEDGQVFDAAGLMGGFDGSARWFKIF